MTEANEEEREKSRNVGSLRALWPFVRRYRFMLFGAIAALITTAMVSLILPIAVRRVVDGFETSAEELLDGYFAVALAIALLLAVGTGLRYYLVTRLGERVVADIR
ncbi:MAG: ABC transporter, partial [Pseudomonadota bacterium]